MEALDCKINLVNKRKNTGRTFVGKYFSVIYLNFPDLPGKEGKV